MSGSKPTLKFEIVHISPDYSEIENRRYRLNMKINISAKLWHMGLFFGGFGFESYRKFINFFCQIFIKPTLMMHKNKYVCKYILHVLVGLGFESYLNFLTNPYLLSDSYEIEEY